MKIKHLHIENFKSIDQLDLACRDLTVLLGKNSIGKSNILLALDLFFNTSDKTLIDDVFCSFVKERNDIVVEITFDNLTEAEKTGRLNKYICSAFGPGIKVKKTVRKEEGKLKSSYQGWVEEPEIEWLKSDFKGYGKQSYWQEQNIDFFAYTEASGGRITREFYEEFRTNYIEKHANELKFELTLSDTNFEGLKTVGIDMLPQFKLIPAIGDVSEVVAGTSKSLLSRIVHDIIKGTTENINILKAAEDGLSAAAALINRNGEGVRLPQIKAVENWFQNELAEWGKLDFEIKTFFHL
jgi:putative ATP-dependent endonuclease of the OLD family